MSKHHGRSVVSQVLVAFGFSSALVALAVGPTMANHSPAGFAGSDRAAAVVSRIPKTSELQGTSSQRVLAEKRFKKVILKGGFANALLAAQPDGRVVVAGLTKIGSRFVVARLLPDGAIDPSFRQQTKQDLITQWSCSNSVNLVHALSLLPDGRMYIAGDLGPSSADAQGAGWCGGLYRLLPDGTVDTTFKPPWLGANPASVLVQPDGKILVSGEFWFTGDPWPADIQGADFVRTGEMGVIRLMPDGSLDPTFSMVRPWDQKMFVPYLVGLQSDGRLITFLRTWFHPHGSYATGSVQRYNVDGSLDATFKIPSGVVDSEYDYAKPGVLMMPDGGLMVGFTNKTLTRGSLKRFDKDGKLDNTFRFSNPSRAVPTPWALQGSRIVVSLRKDVFDDKKKGYTHTANRSLLRLQGSGRLDRTFQERALTVGDVAVQQGGGLIVAGSRFYADGRLSNRWVDRFR